jgi:AcrR family transcriptional regulator
VLDDDETMPATAPGESRRGRRRRAQLLAVLEELLETTPLADVQIDDVASKAGIARSGFYFYFPTKSAAVAALIESVMAELVAAGADWYEGQDPDHIARVSGSIVATVAAWRSHAPLITAMFDATHLDPDVRRTWADVRETLADGSAERLDAERLVGMAPPGLASRDLTVPLVEMTAAMMERDVRSIIDTGKPVPRVIETLIYIWDSALYGSPATPADGTQSAGHSSA